MSESVVYVCAGGDLKSVRKAAGALGAYVDLDLDSAVESDVVFDDVQAALLEHDVLFFRNQTLSAERFGAFAKRFGEVEPHPAYPTVNGAPDVQILESTAEKPSKIEVWHSDMTFRAKPPAVTLLYAQIVPEFGGDTLWASAAAAYTSLSEPLKSLIADLRAENDFAHGFKESLEEPGGGERLREALEANPPVQHAIVREHPQSGKRALYVNALFTTRVIGLSRAESDAVLALLFNHITAVENTVRLSWEPGTIAIWDNRTTQHKPVNDFFPQHRMLYRVTVSG